MTKIYLLISATLIISFLNACDSAGKPVVESNNGAPVAAKNDKPQTAIAHSLENQTPKDAGQSGEKSKWTQSGDPVDTKEFDSAIASAEVALNKKPSDADAKKALGAAYFNRAEALTKARQYASALGDYRRALKYDPSNSTAKEWIDQISSIYASMNRESPKEGEEPPPLPLKK
jgi:tetratricopeptide (TPR) repeat protein